MLTGVLALLLTGSGGFDGSTLDEKIKAILPTSSEEKWRQIPWRLSVMEARADAQKAGKPLFFWIMNGHPFGCT